MAAIFGRRSQTYWTWKGTVRRQRGGSRTHYFSRRIHPWVTALPVRLQTSWHPSTVPWRTTVEPDLHPPSHFGEPAAQEELTRRPGRMFTALESRILTSARSIWSTRSRTSRARRRRTERP